MGLQRREGNEPLASRLFSLHTLGRLCSPYDYSHSRSRSVTVTPYAVASSEPAPTLGHRLPLVRTAAGRSTCLFHLTERKRSMEGRKGA